MAVWEGVGAMIVENHQANCAVIVVHEIYGINEHMKDICRLIEEFGFDVYCPNLLEKDMVYGYSEEKAAYQNFVEEVGVIAATLAVESLISSIKNNYQKVFVVGFSVGATVSWLCSGVKGVHGIVGYYGSRIRDFADLTPKCPVLLFFPQEERSFDVDELISSLDKRNTEIHKLNGRHGFSDPSSPEYNKESANKTFYLMKKFLLEDSLT